MLKRKLGWTDLELSEIGIGTWAMGGAGWVFSWGSQEDQDSIAAIQRAVELGVNWIDTAPIYGLGHAEEVVGEAVRYLRPRPLIATKFSRVWDANGQPHSVLKANSLRQEMENSLRRLGVEAIDLYQMHWPRPEEDLEEAWGVVADLIQQGKVRYGGVCNFNLEHLKRVQAVHPVASLQPPYSMLRREVEDGLLHYCQEQGIGVVAYSPMQKGLLTDKFSREWADRLAKDDHRRNDPDFQEPRLSDHLELVDGLRRIAEKYGRSVSELALAWVLRRPEVTSAIVGARRPEQIEQTVNASGWVLSEEDQAEIEQLLSRLPRPA